MKRTPLRRRAPMPRGKPLSRSGFVRRAAILAAAKPGRRRRTGFDQVTRALVRDRDAVCQGCGLTPGQARAAGLRLEVHHRLAAGRGGPDVPSNGVLLCGLGTLNVAGLRPCHWRVDHDRAWALARGLVLPTGTAHTMAYPVTDWAGRAWLLADDGTRWARADLFPDTA